MFVKIRQLEIVVDRLDLFLVDLDAATLNDSESECVACLFRWKQN